MYAITSTGYRSIASADELRIGETLAEVVPEDLVAAAAASEGRALRDRLLRECDWTQLPDAPLSAEQRNAFSAYRQALRDLPSDLEFPHGEWPTVPAMSGGVASETGETA